VAVTVLGDVTIGGVSPFTIDASKLPEGIRSVRIEGQQANTTVRVSEAAANTPSGKYVANRPLSAVTVVGPVDVSVINLRFLAAAEASQTRRTDAPAIARVAVDVSGSTGGRATLRLTGVSVEGGAGSTGANVPFYEGLRAKNALVQLIGSRIYAYKRAVGVEDTDLSVIGTATNVNKIHSGVLKDTSAPLLSMIFTSEGVGRSLAGTASNFPALELGARTRAFIANANVKGPLGIAWVGSGDGESEEERAVFYETSIGGPGSAGPVSMVSEATGLFLSGSGTLRLVKPTISNTYTPVECADTTSSDVPLLKLIQQSYSCVGIERFDMIGDGMCIIEQNEDWAKDENWPGCVAP
jgi:hypothetical protein